MKAYLLERLFPTGWRRNGELHWRLSDAKAEARRLVDKGNARAIRVLPVNVEGESVYSIEPDGEVISA